MATKKAGTKENAVKVERKTADPATKPAKSSSRCGTRKAGTKGAMKTGSKYVCYSCGLVVSVDTACGCAEAHELICCGSPMKAKN